MTQTQDVIKLFCDLDPAIGVALAATVKREGRTKREVVQRALQLYFAASGNMSDRPAPSNGKAPK